MGKYSLTLTTIWMVSLILTGCGGSQQQTPAAGQERFRFHERLPGPGMPAAEPDEFIITDDGKIASALYHKFWADSVNHHSSGRWDVFNNAGFKAWILSNTYNSSPKAWLMGGNYWNGESDGLYSHDFTIPDSSGGVRLTFWARWKIASDGDYCDVNYWVDGSPQLVTAFDSGQNPDYPGWTKYYFVLPDNFSGDDQTCFLEFIFESGPSGNDWGVGLDNVAVYQRALEPPINVDATDGNFSLNVSWDYADTGTLNPDAVDIYRAFDETGPYSYQDTVNYPGTLWNDSTAGADVVYWYVLVATKDGWADSEDSIPEDGWYTFGPP